MQHRSWCLVFSGQHCNCRGMQEDGTEETAQIEHHRNRPPTGGTWFCTCTNPIRMLASEQCILCDARKPKNYGR